MNTATDTKRRALAALLNVQPEAVTTDDPGGKLFTVDKTDYAVFNAEIVARDFAPVGCKDGFWCYRLK